ncbi:hypothetical protein [Cylindrospermopsis raciborskii]|uniref:hypothetical protein n=2 Tax=Cylindrospermopsis raciborskii TaxID=77022 RepID=UPI002EDA64FF
MGGIDMVRQVPPKTQLGVIKSNKNQLGETIAPEIVYPESDGQTNLPMAQKVTVLEWVEGLYEEQVFTGDEVICSPLFSEVKLTVNEILKK